MEQYSFVEQFVRGPGPPATPMLLIKHLNQSPPDRKLSLHTLCLRYFQRAPIINDNMKIKGQLILAAALAGFHLGVGRVTN